MGFLRQSAPKCSEGRPPYPHHGSEFPSGNCQTGTQRKRGQQGLHLPRNWQGRLQGRIRGVAQGTWASPHPGNLTPFPRLKESSELSQKGQAQGPPQTLEPQNSRFLRWTEETKVIWNLSSPLLSPVSPGPGTQEGTERSLLVGILQKKQGNGWGWVPSLRGGDGESARPQAFLRKRPCCGDLFLGPPCGLRWIRKLLLSSGLMSLERGQPSYVKLLPALQTDSQRATQSTTRWQGGLESLTLTLACSLWYKPSQGEEGSWEARL